MAPCLIIAIEKYFFSGLDIKMRIRLLRSTERHSIVRLAVRNNIRAKMEIVSRMRPQFSSNLAQAAFQQKVIGVEEDNVVSQSRTDSRHSTKVNAFVYILDYRSYAIVSLLILLKQNCSTIIAAIINNHHFKIRKVLE